MGGYKDTLFSGAFYNLTSLKAGDISAYVLPQGAFFIPFYRPFGLWLTPQKSAFIFPIAIIVQYIYKKDIKNNSSSMLWYALFIFSNLLMGAKTALMACFIILSILHMDFVKQKMSVKQFIFLLVSILFFLSLVFFSISFSKSEEGTTTAINKDIQALLNLPLRNILFGKGFVEIDTLKQLGFAIESYLVRLIVQIGLIFFLLYSVVFSISVFKKFNAINVAIFVLFYFMMVHYSVTNIVYFVYVICIILHYNNNYAFSEKYSSNN